MSWKTESGILRPASRHVVEMYTMLTPPKEDGEYLVKFFNGRMAVLRLTVIGRVLTWRETGGSYMRIYSDQIRLWGETW